jgi:hypothetical protein
MDGLVTLSGMSNGPEGRRSKLIGTTAGEGTRLLAAAPGNCGDVSALTSKR